MVQLKSIRLFWLEQMINNELNRRNYRAFCN